MKTGLLTRMNSRCLRLWWGRVPRHEDVDNETWTCETCAREVEQVREVWLEKDEKAFDFSILFMIDWFINDVFFGWLDDWFIFDISWYFKKCINLLNATLQLAWVGKRYCVGCSFECRPIRQSKVQRSSERNDDNDYHDYPDYHHDDDINDDNENNDDDDALFVWFFNSWCHNMFLLWLFLCLQPAFDKFTSSLKRALSLIKNGITSRLPLTKWPTFTVAWLRIYHSDSARNDRLEGSMSKKRKLLLKRTMHPRNPLDWWFGWKL